MIGEDLGTVPEGFRETMAQWGLWSYRVMLFEREHDGRVQAARDLSGRSARDLQHARSAELFAAGCTSHDLRVKRGIGLDPGESDERAPGAQTRMREVVRAAR